MSVQNTHVSTSVNVDDLTALLEPMVSNSLLDTFVSLHGYNLIIVDMKVSEASLVFNIDKAELEWTATIFFEDPDQEPAEESPTKSVYEL